MARKMYYTEQEAADRLGVSPDQLAQYVREQRLQIFKDGDRNMYKGDEVEALAVDSGDAEEIELVPAEEMSLGDADPMARTVQEGPLGDADPMARTVQDVPLDLADPMAATAPDGLPGDADPMARTVLDAPKGTGDMITLADVEEPSGGGGKEDTVITAEGISIFDEEDLEIETADPMAKTQIAPSLEDQIAIEGVGSGSGLLDLTRESDDTSLGAELLDHIDLEESPDAAVTFEEAHAGPETLQPVTTEVVIDSSQVTEAPDPMAGLFSGILVGCAAVAMLIGAVVIAGITGAMPGYIKSMDENLTMVMGGAIAIAIVAGGLGLVISKSATSRRI